MACEVCELTFSTAQVSLDGSDLEEVKEIYIFSKVDRAGGTEVDVKARRGKARMAFTSLKNIWKCRHISTKTKLQFFKS